MKKLFIIAAIAIMAIFTMVGTASAAYNLIFSKELSDWGGVFDKDTTTGKIKFVIEGRLASGKTFDGLQTFNENTAYKTAWETAYPTAWSKIKDEKFALMLWNPVLAGKKWVPIAMTCVKEADATSSAGEQFKCTQQDGVELDMTDNELLSYAQYLYVILLSAEKYNTTPNKTMTWTMPLNLAALVGKGISTETATDTDGDGIVDDLDNCLSTANADQADSDDDGTGDACETTETTCDSTTEDCDGDGIVGSADACPDEAGTGTDGCPVSADTTTTVGDGGGCSVLPAAAPNVLGLLALAAALIPLTFRRKK